MCAAPRTHRASQTLPLVRALLLTLHPSGSGWFRTDNFALTRYSESGALDPTFGAAGTVVTDVSGVRTNNEAFAVAIQPDGRILAAGVSSGVGWADFAAARFQP